MTSTSFRLFARPGVFLGAAALCLASVAVAQTQPTEPPPTPAPTAAPPTPVPTIAAASLKVLPALQAGDEPTLAVALPASGVAFESTANLADTAGWGSEASRVPASGVAVLPIVKTTGEPTRIYRVRTLP